MPASRTAVFLCLLLLPATASAQVRVQQTVARGPMTFEENRGQTDARVRFLARGKGYTLFLTPDEAVFALGSSGGNSAAIRMRLVGAKSPQAILGVERLSGNTHYLRGSDTRQWTTSVPTYGRVRYLGVYRGVDLVYYGNEQQLEYDFIVAPGIDPAVIRARFSGVDAQRIADDGELILRVGRREVRQRRPVAYQVVAGVRREIAAEYALDGRGGVGFKIEEYDATLPLTIDPVLVYSTFLGGSSEVPFGAKTIAFDGSGAAYVGGVTTSPDFPTTSGAFQEVNNGGNAVCQYCDGFVTKFDANGAIVYSTYFGGHGTNDVNAIAIDSGAVYIVGTTTAPDFPTTPGAFQRDCAKFPPPTPLAGSCNVGFVAKLNASGSDLAFSTYLGGAAAATLGFGTIPHDVALDQSRNIVVGGSTGPGFPVTPGAFQGVFRGALYTAFVAKLSATGSTLLYGTYLGGQRDDSVNGLRLDAAGNVYVAGGAESFDFPTTAGALQRGCVALNNRCQIAFVAKLNSAATSLMYSTFLGGMSPLTAPANYSSAGYDIAVDQLGFAYVAGQSWTSDFPTTPGSVKPATTTFDAFVAKLNTSGTSLVYSTYLGGDTAVPNTSGVEAARAIAVDAVGTVYVAGWSHTSDFPLVNPVQPSFGLGFNDAFVSILDPTGSTLLMSTYIGGTDQDEANAMTVDESGNVYVAGITRSADFPVVNAAQPTVNGDMSSFVAKMNVGALPCGIEVTDQVGLLQSAIVPFFAPFNLQLVIVWNQTASPVAGPIAYVMDDLQNAVFVGRSKTRCVSPEGDPLTLVPIGDDAVLAPNEARLMGLWFYQTQLGPISYTPRLLGGHRKF